MKTLKVLTLFLLFSQVVLAQDFAPVGSTWHYSYYDISGLVYYKIESLKDTLIQSNMCKKLSVTYYSSQGSWNPLIGYEYLYTSGDIVYRLAQNDVFYVLYNFGAQVGDKWTVRSTTYIYPTTEIEAEIEVISIGTTVINGKTLRQLHVLSNNSDLEFSFSGFGTSLITETLGSEKYMFPDNFAGADVAIIEGLRCYDDTDFGHYNSNFSPTCDYIYTAIEKQTEENTFQLYPNPTTQNISLVSPFTNQKQEAYIYTLDGRLVSTHTMTSEEITINLEALEKGTYLLKIQAEGKEAWVRKVVKL